MTRFSRVLFPLITAFLGSAGSSLADPYALDWVRTDFFGQRDLATGVVVNSNDAPLVSGAAGPLYGTNPSTLGSQVATVARFSTTGQFLGSTPAYASLQLDHVFGTEIDPFDNLFIAGETYRYQGAEAYLVKFSPQGSVQWERHLGTSSNEFGRDVAVDAVGNAYLLGSTTGVLAGATNTGYDAFIAKYSPTGNLLLLRQYADNSVSTIPSAIAVHGTDMFVVGPEGAQASTLTRLDAVGGVIWSIHPNYASSPGKSTQLYDLAVDIAGNIYTCGFTDSVYDNGSGFQGGDAVVAKHSADGALIWQRRLNTAENDFLSSIHIDALGDVYVAGSRTDSQFISAGDYDAIWAKYNPQGDLLWQQAYATSGAESGAAISVDSKRNVYLAGHEFRTANGYYAGNADSILIRYSFVVPEPTAAYLLLTIVALIPAGRHWRPAITKLVKADHPINARTL